MIELLLHGRAQRFHSIGTGAFSPKQTMAKHNGTLGAHTGDRSSGLRFKREHYCVHNRRAAGERQLKFVAHRPAKAGSLYPRHWVGLAILGAMLTAVGLVAGVVVPGPLTGSLFPIGVTILLVVAYGARKRGPG